MKKLNIWEYSSKILQNYFQSNKIICSGNFPFFIALEKRRKYFLTLCYSFCNSENKRSRWFFCGKKTFVVSYRHKFANYSRTKILMPYYIKFYQLPCHFNLNSKFLLTSFGFDMVFNCHI